MKVSLLFHTVIHLRWTQIAYQLRYRLHRATYKEVAAPQDLNKCRLLTEPIARPTSWDKAGQTFTFLNIADSFQMWNDMRHGALWAYNLNYMDWLNQPDVTAKDGAAWMGHFINDIHYNNIGLDPYPTALRCINWIKFICLIQEKINNKDIKRWNDSLYSQYRLLERRLEYHLLGNHLLEDAYSLCIGAVYFADKRMWEKASVLLRKQLEDQILPDGAHYEQSPMYHCILLDRLLDVYNFFVSNPRFGQGQKDFNSFLRQKAVAMLGHLDSIIYKDYSFPHFNDAAEGIAPTPKEIKDYARRLGLMWQQLALNECGYRHLQTGVFEAFVDVGGIAATYQPGHSHADTLNYELRIGGKPFIVDTGISTYDKTPRRQYERSTAAHNTVTIDGKDSAEVWGGFRLGRRSKVHIVEDTHEKVTALCTGIKKGCWHKRQFAVVEETFAVSDTIPNNADSISRIHLSPDIIVKDYSDKKICTDIATIYIENATKVEVKDAEVSTEYNRLMKTSVVEIHFRGGCRYKIIQTNKQR